MPFKIISVGDYMTGENVHHYRRGIPTKYYNKFKDLLNSKVYDVVADGDILFVNFESSLFPKENLDNLPIEEAVYTAPLETLELLKSLNVKIVANIANNHFAQHGPERSKYTISQLESNDIIVIGKDNLPTSLGINGNIIKAWGVSLVKDKTYEGAYFLSNYQDLISDLNLSAKAENETWIISIHWGDEYLTLQSEEQKTLAEKLSKTGFDLILGHHPHTIQSVEKIDNSWVAYSHGNFLFDQNFSALTQKGLISVFNLPENELELYITQQKHYRVVDIIKVSVDELNSFCTTNYSSWEPLKMRIKMKAELITHFYELNFPIIKTFGGRIFR